MKKAPQADFPAFEAEMLKTWADEDIFQRSLDQRRSAPRFSFYDGPPFANGLPHFGHTLVTSIKDALGRYRTMRGYLVERRNGWDCHGLPVEFAIEKDLGVSGKKQILDGVGLQAFNDACRASVFKYKNEWEDFYRRAGRWTDANRSYQTIDRNYTESVWWMLSQVHAKTDHEGRSLLYRGYKSMPYCPRCETPLSNFELNEGYKDDVSDPSVFAKFELVDRPGTFFLAWTTTPWTLPVNTALSVDPEADYVTVEMTSSGDTWQTGERFILAEARLNVLELRQAKYQVVETVKGAALYGLKYRPLFDFYHDFSASESVAVHRMYLDPEVSLDDGTGILHSAPLYGETDLALGQREGLPMLKSAGPDGKMVAAMGPYAGMFFKKADAAITADLVAQGKLFAAETFRHTYPFCYRCDTPLLYYAIGTWFVRVSAVRDELLRTADDIEWTPAHIKKGRFGKWLAGARDWAISRNRYWGAPLPIWVNEADEGDYLVIGSLEELVRLAGLEASPEDVHRPSIDAVVIRTSDGQTYDPLGKVYRRVDEVFDCWFESGSMPAAQHHYPFENQAVFEASFPADYIGEGLDQTRLWFYVQHVLSTIVFGKPAYKHVLVNGMIMAADGQKLSKRLRNYPPVEDVFATEGADTLRFYLLGNDQALGADYMRFDRGAMQDILRNFFMTLWNSYSFLSLYAELDGWEPTAKLTCPVSANLLDQWLLARLHETTLEVTKQADNYKVAAALRPIRELVSDLSNWYVRRSRRRFWKSEDDADKASAYATLHYVLCRCAQLLAPWSPFIADTLWRGLTAGMDEPVSVHLSDWPVVLALDPDSEQALVEMAQVRLIVEKGLSARAASKIKVRQPLALLSVSGSTEVSEQGRGVILDEVNVKDVHLVPVPTAATAAKAAALEVVLDTAISPELKREGLMRDVIRAVQNARKQAGLQVEDRIHLALKCQDKSDLLAAIREHRDVIMAETLATQLKDTGSAAGVPVRVGGDELYIELTAVQEGTELRTP